MAIIPQGVENLYAAVVSYAITILTILVIVKIGQTIGAIGGFGGGSGGGDGDKEGKGSGDKKTKAEKVKEREEKRIAKDKFDPYTTTQVKFRVIDEVGGPISGALVTITPAYAKPRIWGFRNKHTWRRYVMRTDSNGMAPPGNQYETMGTGTVRIKVVGHQLSKKDVKYDFNHYELHPEQQPQLITLTVTTVYMEKDDLAFEPKIRNVAVDKDELVLEGIIE